MEIVSLRKCPGYEYENVKAAIERSIADLGGLEKYLKPGERVLLKPNLIMKKKPDDCATTHPTLIKALAELIIGFGCEVIIGDSPGGPFTENYVSGIYRATGMEQVAAETGAKLNRNFGLAEVRNPDGKYYKKLSVVDMLNDADKVISISKIKTHGMMTYSGAVKNLFGTIHGLEKAKYHLNMPSYDDFADALLDICLNANPVLSFMDSIYGMEGAGPTAGTPKYVGAVVASASPYHLDKVACSLINLQLNEVPTITQSIKRGLITGDMSDIELVGGEVSDFLVKDFDIPEAGHSRFRRLQKGNSPEFVLRLVNHLFKTRPVFDKKKCIGCKACEESCPAKVIKVENKDPKVNLDECIRCFCCQELCPKIAVKIHRPLLSKLLR